MGSLESLTLFNFKSYNDTVTAELGGHFFVSIVGPNGAGKSNLMDAISFVLGLGLEELRGVHWDDLVSKSYLPVVTDSRGTKESAFVEIIYNSESDGQIAFKRAIEAGLNKTSFYINGDQVDKNTYRETLKRHQILQQGRNFLVFQGDVESIASKTPSELADIVETISGSIKFKEEYDQLTSTVEKSKKQLAASREQKRELQRRIQLNSDKQLVDDEHSQILRELNAKKQERLVAELAAIYENKQSLERRANALELSIADKSKSLSGTESERVQAQQLLAKEKKKLSAIKHEISQTKSEIVRLSGEIAPLEKKAEIIEEQLAASRPRRDAAKADVDRISAELSKISDSIGVSLRAQEEILNRAGPIQEKFSQIPKRTIELYERLDAKFTSTTAEAQSQLDHARLDLRNEERKLKVVQAQYDTTAERQAELQEQLSNCNEDMLKCISKLDSLKEKEQLQRDNLSELSEQTRIASDVLEEQSNKLKEGASKLKNLDNSKRASQRRLKLLDSVAKLKRYRPGVIDLLSNIITPKEQQYQRAVDRALASHFDSIVVDSFETVKDCIAHAKELGMGALTFLPLNTLRVEPIETSLRTVHPQAKLAMDCVNYSERYKLAVAFALGDKILCETSEVASELRFTRKIKKTFISLDGTVFSKGSLIEGGVSQTSDRYDEKNVLQLQRQIKGMVEKIHTLTESLTELRDREEVCSKELNHTKASIESQEAVRQELEQQIESHEREEEHLQSELSSCEPEIEALQRNIKSLSAKVTKLDSTLSAKREQALKSFTEQISMSLREFESSKTKIDTENSEIAAELRKLREAEVAANTRLEDAKRRLQKLVTQRTNLKEMLNETTTSEQLKTELESTQAQQNQLMARLEAASQRVEEAAQRLDQFAIQETEQSNEATVLQDELAEVNEELEKLSASESAVLNAAANDGMVFSSEEISGFKEQALAQIAEAGDGDGDVDMITRGADHVSTISRLTNEVDHLAERLEATAGLKKADTSQAEQDKKLKKLDESIEQQLQSLTELENTLSEVKTSRINAFMPAFKTVEQSIDEIYKELTTTETHPFGGSATLNPLDHEEPYLRGIQFSVMPPTKRYKEIQQLSGGEKTVAALALLFAIQRYRPSPFFVLDEIDAALDPTNIKLVASFIKRHMGPGFQFIVISLKLAFFEKADALVGVHRPKNIEGSQLLMVDL